MTAAPVVELGFNPTELRPQDLPRAGAFLGSPAEALEAALAVTRAAMVDQLKAETRGLAEPTQAQLLRIADLAWQAVAWRFRKISAPVLADAYIRTYRAADAGDVPMSVIYELADRHAEKIGEYFHASSREALAEGFTLQVNRRLPAKAAANTVLEAYGLAPRQMRSYVTTQFNTPISDVLPRSLKAKARAYVDKSFTSRIRKLSAQEEHNIDQQAQQLAWMWLQDKGRLPTAAQKMWLTAKDEKTCPVCAPLHGKKVGVNERFVTSQGEFWTPGLHPNCRCRLRLLEHTFTKSAFGTITKVDFDPRQHPRGGDPENRGRFSSRPGPRFKEREDELPLLIPPIPDVEPEPEEPEPRLRMESGKLRMGGAKLRMGPTLSMGSRQLSMSGQTTEEPQKLRMGGTHQHKLSMTMPKLEMAADRTLIEMLYQAKEYQRPERREPKTRVRPTLHIQDSKGREYSVYAVVGPNTLNWAKDKNDYDKVELTHEISFTPSLARARNQAHELFVQQQRDKVDQISESADLVALDHTDRNGHTWMTNMSYDEIEQVVRWAALQGRVRDPEKASASVIEIEYRDDENEVMYMEHRVSELASALDVSPKDFDIRILLMDEGHASDDGETVMKDAETKSGYEEWVTSGRYHASKFRFEGIGDNANIGVWQIVPDVKEYEIPFYLPKPGE